MTEMWLKLKPEQAFLQTTASTRNRKRRVTNVGTQTQMDAQLKGGGANRKRESAGRGVAKGENEARGREGAV